MSDVTDFWFIGTIFTRLEGDEFRVFAPNAKAFQEAVDKISEATTYKVSSSMAGWILN